ncbi:DUF6665 family protein [Stappia sp.]|uniref:DUF6665 family protein n=1 Tax=Stappia sp. TaxID=1870903 RepID=UPI003A99EB8C
MSLRSPEIFRPRSDDPLGEALRQEEAAEKIATLVRLNKALESALASLHRCGERFHAASPDEIDAVRARWRRRHAEAAEALWHSLIQRELCGLRRHGGFLKELAVPRSVQLLMGPAATAADPPDPPSPPDTDTDTGTGTGIRATAQPR